MKINDTICGIGLLQCTSELLTQAMRGPGFDTSNFLVAFEDPPKGK